MAGVVGLGVAGAAAAVFGPLSAGAHGPNAASSSGGGAGAGPGGGGGGAATGSATPTATSTPTAEATATPDQEATPTAEATPTVPPAPGAMPTGEVTSYGIRWAPVYSEDFETPAATGRVLSAYPRMGAYGSGKDTSGYGEYAPNQVLSVHDSVLDYHLRSVNGQLLSASVLPDDYAPHSYARVSIRYRATSTPGYKFVGLLWPSSNDWNDGEIDWPEGDLDARPRPASQVVGLRDSTGAHVFLPTSQYFAPSDQTAFHVATTEWSRGIVRFFWDGVPLAIVTQGVPTKPMRVTLQAETWLNDGPPPSSADGHVEIDWVVIYEQA